jgi:hypothetical protein
MFVMCCGTEGDIRVSHAGGGRFNSGMETDYRVLGVMLR